LNTFIEQKSKFDRPPRDKRKRYKSMFPMSGSVADTFSIVGVDLKLAATWRDHILLLAPPDRPGGLSAQFISIPI
jgi:hypothetical protein